MDLGARGCVYSRDIVFPEFPRIRQGRVEQYIESAALQEKGRTIEQFSYKWDLSGQLKCWDSPSKIGWLATIYEHYYGYELTDNALSMIMSQLSA